MHKSEEKSRLQSRSLKMDHSCSADMAMKTNQRLTVSQIRQGHNIHRETVTRKTNN